MPITYTPTTAHLPPTTNAEEAEPLLQWLEEHPDGDLDLSEAESMHTVVVNVLLSMRPRVSEPPTAPRLAAWLVPALAA